MRPPRLDRATGRAARPIVSALASSSQATFGPDLKPEADRPDIEPPCGAVSGGGAAAPRVAIDRYLDDAQPGRGAAPHDLQVDQVIVALQIAQSHSAGRKRLRRAVHVAGREPEQGSAQRVVEERSE